MKHLFRGLFAALCAALLSLTALADVLPLPSVGGDPVITILLIAAVVVVLVLLIRIVRKRKQ